MSRKESLCAHYARVFDCEDFLHPIGYLEKNWMEETWSGGCYTAVMPPNTLTTYGRYGTFTRSQPTAGMVPLHSHSLRQVWYLYTLTAYGRYGSFTRSQPTAGMVPLHSHSLRQVW